MLPYKLYQNKTEIPDDQLVADTQGNILFSFKRVRTLMLFVRFGDDQAANRAWVRDLVLDTGSFPVSSSLKPTSNDSNQVNFFVSATGLAKLGRADLKSSEWDEAFLRGARAADTLEKLNDRAVAEWQAAHREPWDAMVLVACTAAAAAAVTKALLAAGGDCRESHLERGSALDEHGVPRGDEDVDLPSYEAFGYRDGVSRQYFTEQPPSGMVQPAAWGSQRPIALALKRDPLSQNGYGSFFAFRKLRQDVKSFEAHVEDVTTKLLTLVEGTNYTRGKFLFDLYSSKNDPAFVIFNGNPSRDDVKEFVRGRIMGRYSGGAPVRANTGPQSVPDNDFIFADDRSGHSCPFHAHIRSMNARGARDGVATEQSREIVRKSESYVEGNSVAAAGEAGLLFLCAQNSLTEQFEFHQANLGNANPVDLEVEPLHGPDYLVAQARPVADKLAYADNLDRFQRYAATIDIDVRASQFIDLRGAEYFFAPSLSGLRALVTGGAAQ